MERYFKRRFNDSNIGRQFLFTISSFKWRFVEKIVAYLLSKLNLIYTNFRRRHLKRILNNKEIIYEKFLQDNLNFISYERILCEFGVIGIFDRVDHRLMNIARKGPRFSLYSFYDVILYYEL